VWAIVVSSLYRARGRRLWGAIRVVSSALPAVALGVLSLLITHTAHPELATQLLHKLGVRLLHLLRQLKPEAIDLSVQVTSVCDEYYVLSGAKEVLDGWLPGSTAAGCASHEVSHHL
jgi:hypothetical protein